jgi:hypothetical protein
MRVQRSFEDFDAAWAATQREVDAFVEKEGLVLKAVKHSATFSRETGCFKASLYAARKRLATAENDGHGDCTMVFAASPKVRPDYDALVQRWNDHIDAAEDALQLKLDGVVERMLHIHLQVKKAKTCSRSKIAWYTPDGKMIQEVKWPDMAALWKQGGVHRHKARALFREQAEKQGWLDGVPFTDVVFLNDVALGLAKPV